MIRKIIRIDEEKCIGCGICAAACHEGAIDIVDGKARLVRENFCDGFGDCLPGCPAGAISFEEREAPEYDEKAVQAAKGNAAAAPGILRMPEMPVPGLRNWPVQIRLAPLKSPAFDGADLLIAADCTAFAYTAFHRDFGADRAVLIACSKLDSVDYSIKLTEIFRNNAIRSLVVLRMEVPCCGGLEMAVKRAADAAGKKIPLEVVTIRTDGTIKER